MKKVDHIGVAVKSIEEVMPFYTDILGFPCLGIEDVQTEGVRVAFMDAGNLKIELLQPLSDESAVYKFLEKRGQGIHHIALAVDSIEERIKDLKFNGIQMLQEEPKKGAGGALVAFMHPASGHRVLYELCEKK